MSLCSPWHPVGNSLPWALPVHSLPMGDSDLRGADTSGIWEPNGLSSRLTQ